MESTKKILVVEDDPGLQKQMKWSFDDFEVFVAGDRKEALKIIAKEHPSVATVDLGLPPDPEGSTEGLATVEDILAAAPNTKVIVVSGNDERSNAVQAVASGAYDFYQKPIDSELLNQIVTRAHHVFELEEENRRLTMEHIDVSMEGMIANSPQMQTVCQRVEKVAPSDATVLLLGDSGTGKEVCARALHGKNPSISGRFVAINCAAIPENLLESELFGYEKGAFTGATKTTPGKIEYAEGGTLFLDEMGELPMSLQAKLLRFLQERVVERIGGREEIAVNVRVICATHQDLEDKIEKKEFREDLYYRINEIPINIPPLKDRDGDVLLLARSFFDQINLEQGKKLKGFTKDALTALDAHKWPGNVRELKNRIKRAVIMADGKHITAVDLELTPAEDSNEVNSFDLREVRVAVERQVITKALNHTNGKVSPAAELLGVSRPTLYDLIQKLGINV
ncbi:MAG: PEP-CTERM-box response regulator transcription factor [endosymbiont of Galathealinum brachiosum]|uniref:PEP-CTERM-box response regulator transcription factor n=1 Tax=endosymbiont of Galathealinum brachiosum TaxID=2200906 RepID=A0A370D8W2_9GAMM|nr:MAG: PEP-CTERM-box response regulator transcription factor [endosymbiont of Galathealinum brachiosum]